MKKPHKKAHKPQSKRRHRHRDAAPALAPHSSRRSPQPARPEPRRTRPHRPQPVGVYRRPNPLAIESTADRHAFRVLLLPFVLMAFALAIVPSLHVFPTLRDLIAATPINTASVAPAPSAVAESGKAPVAVAVIAPPALAAAEVTEPVLAAVSTDHNVASPGDESLAVAMVRPPQQTLTPTQPTPPVVDFARPADRLRSRALNPETPLAMALPRYARATPQAARPARKAVTAIPEVRAAPPRQELLRPSRSQLAMLHRAPAPITLSPLPPRPYQPYCPVAYGSAAEADMAGEPISSAAPFGQRLAAAAAQQMTRFVIYDDKYRQIARTGGDVPPLYGVCTDVVVRAYRTLGIDLQVLVQAAHVGTGDPNIDHRRTETLRRYFARYGQSLPVTPHGEDYQPGDIVTYWRPQNSGSRSHIAIVATAIGPSGRPMIIHNRGWGPQLEDGLFVDRITGHYRYDATARPPLPPQLATTSLRPFTAAKAATPVTLPTPPSAPSSAGL